MSNKHHEVQVSGHGDVLAARFGAASGPEQLTFWLGVSFIPPKKKPEIAPASWPRWLSAFSQNIVEQIYADHPYLWLIIVIHVCIVGFPSCSLALNFCLVRRPSTVPPGFPVPFVRLLGKDLEFPRSFGRSVRARLWLGWGLRSIRHFGGRPCVGSAY